MEIDSWKQFDFDFAPQESHEGEGSRMTLGFPPDHKGVLSSVKLSHDEDLQAVAMVYAMLSEGLAQFLHDAGKWARNEFIPSGDGVVTATGLTPQI